MECNEVFSISRSTILGGRKHGFNSAATAGNKEMDRILWNSPPVGTLQSASVAASSDQRRHSHDTRTTNGGGGVVKYHVTDDDDVVQTSSPVELCDVAVLKITDATTTSVVGASSPSTVLTQDDTASPPPPPASVTTAPPDTEDSRRRLRRWLDLCHCERHLIAIKLFYFTFIGALGVCIAYAVVFLKQVGLSAFQIGVISGVRPVLGFVSAPAWGAVADR